MNKVPLYLIFTTLLIFLIACNRDAEQTTVKHYDLSDNWKSAEEVKLSGIADDIEYIPLETKPECLIGNHRALKVIPVDNYLVVHEHNKVMRIFSREGKYICDVGIIGKGPDEYIQSNSFYIDERLKLIYIISLTKECMIYGIDGKLKNKFKIDEFPDRIIVNKKEEIGLLYLSQTVLLKDKARIDWHLPDGEFISTIKLYGDSKMGGGKTTSSNVRLYWQNDAVRFGEVPFDTVYQLNTHKKFEPIYSFESGNLRVPEVVLHDWASFTVESNNYTIIYFLEDSDNFFFLTGGFERKTYNILVDKNSGLVKTVDIKPLARYSEETGFINDLDGGLPFWPKTIYNNQAITCLTPLDLLESLKSKSDNGPAISSNLSTKYKAIVESLSENDNPVVMIVSLK